MRFTAFLFVVSSELITLGQGFTVHNNYGNNGVQRSVVRPRRQHALSSLYSTPSNADFEKPRVVADGRGSTDPNKYNVALEQAAELWTVSVSEEKNADRAAGVPFLNTLSKNHYVDDLPTFEVSRDGGLGMELLEIAGGRDDGLGVTIVENVIPGGNAARAGILPGDSVAAVTVYEQVRTANVEETRSRVRLCECRDFDTTIEALGSFPGDAATVCLTVKRIRRWPKIQVRVEYPPSQCAEGVDNVRKIQLFAGENLKRALQNRGIILDDPGNPKCDYCGSNACYVSIFRGKAILNPIGITEEKLMKQNPDVRLSCKTTVGYNMQEGELGLRVNLSQWSNDK